MSVSQFIVLLRTRAFWLGKLEKMPYDTPPRLRADGPWCSAVLSAPIGASATPWRMEFGRRPTYQKPPDQMPTYQRWQRLYEAWGRSAASWGPFGPNMRAVGPWHAAKDRLTRGRPTRGRPTKAAADRPSLALALLPALCSLR